MTHHHQFDVPEHIDHLIKLTRQNCAEAYRMGQGALSTLHLIMDMMERGKESVDYIDEFRLMGLATTLSAYMEDYRAAMRKIQADLKQARELKREL